MAGALTISTLKDDTGVLSVQNGMTGICKAWVKFAGGTGAINGSFNVSSVTRSAVGVYAVNFTTAMPNINYAVTGASKNQDNTTTTAGNNPVAVGPISFATGSIGIVTPSTTAGTLVDPFAVSIAVFSS